LPASRGNWVHSVLPRITRSNRGFTHTWFYIGVDICLESMAICFSTTKESELVK